MLIDWVTARVPLELLSDVARAACDQIGDRITRWCPKTGAVQYTTAAWDSIRSDSHQVTVRVGSDLWMQGSPARVIGDGCSVFGAGASNALDIAGCVEAMRRFLIAQIKVDLPAPAAWIVSRIDVTGNVVLDSLTQVRDALRVLRGCEGGRYRVSQQAGDTVYWSHLSKLRTGKAYAKGPHLLHLLKKKTYTGRYYDAVELQKAERLLRMELKLGREFWARNDWHKFSRAELIAEWNDYFLRMIGDADMTRDEDIEKRIMAVALTEGRGKAAYACWLLIQSHGWERAKNATTRTSWYRHMQVLSDAGLGAADVSAGKVVPFRRKIFTAQVCHSWAELFNVA